MMVRAVLRSLAILECFSVDKPAMSLQDIYRRVDLPKSTTLRLVLTLQDAGYLLQRADQRYTLSYKLLLLGSVMRETVDVRDIMRPVMEELARSTGETVTLSTRTGYERICLDVVQSSSQLRSVVLPGDRVPLLYGATGKMFLAQLDDRAVEQVRRTQQVPKKRISRKALAQIVKDIRAHGYTITRDDRVDGVMAISVPIRDASQDVRYCMTITGPSTRFVARQRALIDQMLRVGKRVSTLLGYAQPPPGSRAEHTARRMGEQAPVGFSDSGRVNNRRRALDGQTNHGYGG